MPVKPVNVGIVGAGVVGLTTAVQLLKRGYSVAVLATHFGNQTNSGKAGAIWGPFLSGTDRRVFEWSAETLEVLKSLGDVPDAGIRLVTGVMASYDTEEMPDWFAMLGEENDIGSLNFPSFYKSAWRYRVPLIDMDRYLDWLYRQVHQLGGKFFKTEVLDLDMRADGYDFIVNCSGLGSIDLAKDVSVKPVKGQLLVLEDPGLDYFFAERGDGEELFYWMPHGEKLVIGGTAEHNFAGLDSSEEQTIRILEKATLIEPKIGNAELLEVRVGLRPWRPQIRLERDQLIPNVVHNYGHGGSGVSVSWSCANQVVELIDSIGSG